MACMKFAPSTTCDKHSGMQLPAALLHRPTSRLHFAAEGTPCAGRSALSSAQRMLTQAPLLKGSLVIHLDVSRLLRVHCPASQWRHTTCLCHACGATGAS